MYLESIFVRFICICTIIICLNSVTTQQAVERGCRGIGLFTLKVERNVLDSLNACVGTSDVDNQRPILKISVNNYRTVGG
jgi:hypothetical protein